MKRAQFVIGLVLVLVMAACGGGDKNEADRAGSGSSAASVPASAPTVTAVPTYAADPVLFARGRTQPAPQVEAALFEAPFSVGEFVRRSVRGRASATDTAGQMAVYSNGTDVVVLNVLYFPSSAEAVQTVRYTLEESDPTLQPVEPPLYNNQRSFGVSRDRHGGLTAAWTNGPWTFVARADRSGDALNAFLAKFSY